MPTTTTLTLTPTERVTVLESGPDALVVEVVHDPAGSPPPPHRHPAQDERFTVLDGEVTVRLAGARRVARPGEVVEVPRDTVHAFWNAGEVPARLRWETRPAGRTLAWFEALDAAHRAAGGGRPGLTVFARLLDEHDDVFRLAVPGAPLVGLLLRGLAAVDRRRAPERPARVA